MTDNCPFCDLVANPASLGDALIRETPLTLAFVPLFPVGPGHVLVIPRRHVEDLLDSLTGAEARALLFECRKVGWAMVRGLHAEGINLFQRSGSVAGQTVFHLHFHLVPRWTGDGLERLATDLHGEAAERDAEVAKRIREEIS